MGVASATPTGTASADPRVPGPDAVFAAVHEVPPAEALAAGMKPGSQTFVEPGLTARQAVGLDAIPADIAARLQTGSPSMQLPAGDPCWTGEVSYTWGWWPLEESMYDDAYWCGYYNGSITYRSHSVHLDGTYCSPNGTWSYTSYWYSGSPFWQYVDGGNWWCLNSSNDSHSFTVNVSSSGAMWRS